MQRGADVNKKTFFGNTPLHIAAASGDESIVKILLDYGAQMNEKSLNGETALLKASLVGKVKIVQTLLEHGADMNILDDDGDTPLTCSSLETEKMLVKKIATLKYEKQVVCDENLDYLQDFKGSRRYFNECLEELNRMKEVKINKEISF